MNIKGILVLILVACLMFGLLGSCFSGGHAPGYGNTSKCTICGRTATHKTSNYGFCDTHWADAIGG